ncbi:AIPR family protein [Eubacterium barkeri]|uniref:AIPR protein n=1 Tax=Eubacterium barkeri TaxID=1528 RepID=A0A1H3JTP8_EUBBA|nr:AIPR family protein [Eubacterium barkeri]SDY43292.1 AIPR protein [Eubacterium barkeri]
MDINEYKEIILADVQAKAASEMCDSASAFLEIATDTMIESDEFESLSLSYFEGFYGKYKMQIDGFYYDEFDQSIIILISDFTNELQESSLTNTMIKNHLNRMRYYVEACIKGYIEKNCEESQEAYEFALLLSKVIYDIRKIRFYILTDRVISKQIKRNQKYDDIQGVPIDLSIWDMNRLYNVALSRMQRESIRICFTEYGTKGIPAIKAVSSDVESYESYLAVIQGETLARMYIDHGSRLLEGNVRSFLSVRGKVNKGIRNTIMQQPDLFFAYNNGIAATAAELKLEGNLITEIQDLQIINGGQTTASIANAVLQDKSDVSHIFVPVKLSVVSGEKVEELIPEIARCANTQNKVSEADFFSNHPFHIRMEELSRKTFAPPVGGNQHQTRWYYERARGQHTQEQMKMKQSERKQFLTLNPKDQIIKKVDLAKYIMTKEQCPHIVSTGAQKNMRAFAEIIDKQWKKSDTGFNQVYYRNLCAVAIMFRETERLVSNQQWYKAVKSYRANIVTYSLAVLFHIIEVNYPQKEIDYKRIWDRQSMTYEQTEQLAITTKEVYQFITKDDRKTENVTEWCKKAECWAWAEDEHWTVIDDFSKMLISKNKSISEQETAKKDQKENNEINAQIQVIQWGQSYWQQVWDWLGQQSVPISDMEKSILKLACQMTETGRPPTHRQAKVLLALYNRLIDEGMPKR